MTVADRPPASVPLPDPDGIEVPADDRVREILPSAVALTLAVGRRDREDIARVLLALDRERLHALAVTLAALVDPTELRMLDTPTVVRRLPATAAPAHGTPAALRRHRRDGTALCAACRTTAAAGNSGVAS